MSVQQARDNSATKYLRTHAYADAIKTFLVDRGLLDTAKPAEFGATFPGGILMDIGDNELVAFALPGRKFEAGANIVVTLRESYGDDFYIGEMSPEGSLEYWYIKLYPPAEFDDSAV